ncbi:hypothetical protein [Mesorhizobium sp. M0491]|uniref:hypothetical protein n=1 Tax=Mesorhizobium sp. M0491 TaxID=2956950 RepID=UPI003334A8DA
MDIKARLTQEVQECLDRISSFSWDVHAQAIRKRYPDLLETHSASKLMAFTSMWVTAPDGWTGKMEISF